MRIINCNLNISFIALNTGYEMHIFLLLMKLETRQTQVWMTSCLRFSQMTLATTKFIVKENIAANSIDEIDFFHCKYWNCSLWPLSKLHSFNGPKCIFLHNFNYLIVALSHYELHKLYTDGWYLSATFMKVETLWFFFLISRTLVLGATYYLCDVQTAPEFVRNWMLQSVNFDNRC